MGLKERLARLPLQPGAEPRAPKPVPARFEVREIEADPSGLLAELRRKMAEITGRQVAHEVRPGFDPNLSSLPFSIHETPHGPLCLRREHMALSHRVGKVAVHDAKGATADVLALLALDPAVSRVDLARALYFDTETTGLGGSGTLAFLVGIGYFDCKGELIVEQFLLRNPSEEMALLSSLRPHFEAASALVSFNGKAFDWPLLNDRYVMNHLPCLPIRPHLDLLHIGRRLHRARIGNCSLKSLESRVLGFERSGDIESSEVAACYHHFLRTNDEEALRGVVEHNLWDVLSMFALLALYGEPLEQLHSSDLLGLARTYRRAAAPCLAEAALAKAMGTDAEAEALRMRAELAKARGDRAQALIDFESACEKIDDSKIRLELAKLYEHFVKKPGLALQMVDQGTHESDTARERRTARLRRKLGLPS